MLQTLALALLYTSAASAQESCDDAWPQGCVSVDASVSPSVTLATGATIRIGATVGPQVALGAGATIAERATVLGFLDGPVLPSLGTNAIVSRSAQVGHDVAIGNNAVIGRAVTLGNDVIVGAGVPLSYGSMVGAGSTIESGAVVGALANIAQGVQIRSSAVLARSATIGTGSVVEGILGPEVSVGEQSQVGASARIRKDSTIGDSVVVASGVRVGRSSTIGDNARLESGVQLRANVTIPANCLVPEDTLVPRGVTFDACESVISEIVPQDRLSAKSRTGCLLDDVTGEATCWGSDYLGFPDGGDYWSSTPTGAFETLLAGEDFACGLRPDGSAECFGRTDLGLGNEPTGSFIDLSTGWYSACAVDSAGQVDCWGTVSGTEPTDTVFASHSSSAAGHCGLTPAGEGDCWNNNNVTPSPGPFVELIAGPTQWGCGVRADRTLSCFGFGSGVTNAPSGEFVDVALGIDAGCALDPFGAITCWGDGSVNSDEVPEGRFVDIALGNNFGCATREDGLLACWGLDNYNQTSAPFDEDDDGMYDSDEIAAGSDPYDPDSDDDGLLDGDEVIYGTDLFAPDSDGDGLTDGDEVNVHETHPLLADTDVDGTPDGVEVTNSTDPDQSPRNRLLGAYRNDSCFINPVTESMTCWGQDQYNANTPPAGPWRTVAVGSNSFCGSRHDGPAECWGLDFQTQLDLPTTHYEDISAGNYHGCGVTRAGEMSCWGNGMPPFDFPERIRMEQVDSGSFSCSLDRQGIPVCWGSNDPNTPDTAFERISIGGSHVCGILRDSGELGCFSNATDTYGQLSPPPGTYKDIDAGWRHSCALTDAGAIACWGDNSSGQATPPTSGVYDDIAAGQSHSCALRNDNAVICWGSDAFGQVSGAP